MPVPSGSGALFRCCRAEPCRPQAATRNFADMRAAYDALDEATKAEIEDLVCGHSLIYSRSQLGFNQYTQEELATMAPVMQRLVRTHR